MKIYLSLSSRAVNKIDEELLGELNDHADTTHNSDKFQVVG